MRAQAIVSLLAISLAGISSVVATTTARAEATIAQIQRGKALVDAGDCAACHTAPGGKPFAGGLPLATPFGVIYTPNLTPDRKTGIGGWTQDDIWRAMHEGVGAQGENLYPAFPYPYYTHVSRRDVDDIFAFLQALDPVDSPRRDVALPFPLNIRTVVKGWNLLFFKPGEFQPNSAKTVEWNRGAYLVEGLGHCGGCHTSKNALGADESGRALQGGTLQAWHAPNITGDARVGLGSWSVEDVVSYLKTGRNGLANASGPMSEVVTLSTSRMPEADLRAIAVYLKDQPAAAGKALASAVVAPAGAAIYADGCAACHAGSGEGVPKLFPPLKGSASLQAADPTTVIRVILQGARTVPTDAHPTPASMPAFDWKLDDAQIAAVATYVRNSWGNAAPAVTTEQVRKLRSTLAENRDAE